MRNRAITVGTTPVPQSLTIVVERLPATIKITDRVRVRRGE